MTMDMKTGDLEPALTVIVEDGAGVTDFNDVVSWKILGKQNSVLIVNATPDTVTVDQSNQSKATLTRAWQAGETASAGVMQIEVEAMWPGNRPQTFPAESFEFVRFHPDLG